MSVETLRALLERTKQTLTIPAAEYVSAIPEAWALIDQALSDLSSLKLEDGDVETLKLMRDNRAGCVGHHQRVERRCLDRVLAFLGHGGEG